MKQRLHIDCVEVTGVPRHNKGYGVGHIPVGPQPYRGPKAKYVLYAHVAAYMAAWGPVPDGAIVRHSCDNPPCVNPLHLMIGTHGDNARDRSERGRHQNQRKTHCPHGHEYTEKNTYTSPRGERDCRTCRTRRNRELRERRGNGKEQAVSV